MADHYGTLGVPPDASEDDIRKAYRRARGKAHPDKNGTEDKFRAVQVAYETLSDPERRARHDRGQDDGPIPEKRAVAVAELAKLTIAVADSIDIEHADLVGAVLQHLITNIAQAENTMAEHKKKAAIRRRTAKRLKNKKGGPNILGQYFEGDARQHDAGAAKMAFDLEVAKEMMAILKEHEFEYEKRGPGLQQFSAAGFPPFMPSYRR